MPLMKNPLRLNKLQLRTLTLAQLLARAPISRDGTRGRGRSPCCEFPMPMAITSTSASSRSPQGKRVV